MNKTKSQFKQHLVLEATHRYNLGESVDSIAFNMHKSKNTIYSWLNLPVYFFDPEYYYNQLPETVKQILIGSLLGDGSLTWNCSWAASFRESHCLKQEPYLQWKVNSLSIFDPKINYYDSNSSCVMRTIRTPCLSKLRNSFYPNGSKILPRELIYKELNALGLAVWWQDDGHHRPSKILGKGIRKRKFPLAGLGVLNTQSFSKEDVEWLANDFFPHKFNLHPRLYRQGKKNSDKCWALRFVGQDMINISHIIKNYIVPSMTYKINANEQTQYTLSPV